MDTEASGSGIDTREPQVDTNFLRKDLFLQLQSNGLLASTPSHCTSFLVDYLINKLPKNSRQNLKKEELHRIIKSLVTNIFSRYNQCHRVSRILLKKHKAWFNEPLNLPMESEAQDITKSKSKRGRPKKLFGESSKRTQRRDISTLVTEKDPGQLLAAAQKSLRLQGKRSVSKVIELASSATPKRLKRMQESAQTPTSSNVYTAEKALALMVDTGLTKDGYIRIQQSAKKLGHDIYPSYKAIQAAKLKCYPNSIMISENGVEVNLQGLLDFTIDRLVLVYKDVFDRVTSNSLTVICKWGFDGSGGHSVYKQRFCDSRLYGDSNIILCSVVLLEIRDEDNTYWRASSTSSTRYCRPYMFRILKETNENVVKLNCDIQKEVENLMSKLITINGKVIKLEFVMLPTMFDMKIINILTGNRSSQSCYICKAKSSEMNDIEKIQERTCDTSTYKYGISILHAYIRSMELLLHISYKLKLKKWQARGEFEKNHVKKRQQEITDRFYKEMGLVVDLPKQGGGNSNDGNTARRFFSSPELVANITGLDHNLIERFAIILSTLASGYEIKFEEFKIYCIQTANLYISLYSWYNMSVTVHKLLLHGAEIVKSQPLPIGTLSEDIQETRQKDFKNFRLFYTRKTSRINTNTDIFYRLLITSDPLITSLREKPKKKVVPFAKEVINFFQSPDIAAVQHIVLDDDNDDDNDE